MLPRPLSTAGIWLLAAAPAAAQNAFVNWETPHVHPLERTPGGALLLAVNTPDDRLEVFELASGRPVHVRSIPVGVDPVSVRARSDGEAWVVNHVSDSVSAADLVAGNVVATLATEDEPCDVVFAGAPARAFVSCSQANSVLVFDPASPATAPLRIAIEAEEPRALAVSPDGTRVYAAIHDSGNGSTVLGGGAVTNIGFPPNVVNHASGPYGGLNPPPNSAGPGGFDPPQNLANPAPPAVGLIVKKDALGQWRDDFTGDWTALVSGASAALSGRPVGWDLPDRDVAVIDAAALSVAYATRLMNLCMALAVHPTSGAITVVGTDATNEVRFEPNLRGTFLRVELARVDATGATTLGIADLNPHLSYAAPTVPQAERDRSLGDPRGIAWNAAGTRGYVTGMGSNNVVVVDATGARAGLAPAIEVGEGPTGIVLDEARGQLYVLAKFEGALSVVDLATELETARVRFFDPEPPAIKAGRVHLYGTHENSGLGQIACASCHVDARMDRLAWDLGDPVGAMRAVTGNNLGANVPGLNTGFQPFHPMKGPMATQSLQDIIGKEPLHWRGDRSGLEEFNGAFLALQGDDQNLSPSEMQEYEDFLATIAYPPNPYRNTDNSLPTSLPLAGHFTTGRFGPAGQPLPSGNAVTGLLRYRTGGLDGGLQCVTCHTLPTGAGTDHTFVAGIYQPIPPGPDGEHHLALVSVDGLTNVSMKIPQLRNQYEKVGFNATQLVNGAGFGFLHDGTVDSIERFVNEPVFSLTSDQDTADMVAFMLAFSGSDLPQGSPTALFEPPGPPSQDTHAAVGRQQTLSGPPTAAQTAWFTPMIVQANANRVGLIVKGVQGGLTRGWVYLGAAQYQSDRAGEVVQHVDLLNGAAPGSELTWTVVPDAAEVRMGVDRDADGVFDRDELDLGADPADPASYPGSPGTAFCFGDGAGAACPCANHSPSGDAAGCLSSLGTGARLVATGVASLGVDTIALLGTQMPNSTALYLQGTLREDGGLGTPLHDGLLCAGGSIVRLGTRANVGGASTFPGFGNPLSVRGGVAVPGTRTYQVWYRNAAAFCTPATSNLSNGWEITWAP